MSGRLKITFAPDMPPASVEVVAPDFSTVDRVSLSAGDNKEVDVPSEGSFLRVHLASGESVTLKDPGNLNRTIGLSDILSSRRPRASLSTAPRDRRSSRRDVQRRAAVPVAEPFVKAVGAGVFAADLEGGLKVTLVDDDDHPQDGEVCEEDTTVVLSPARIDGRYLLTMQANDVRVRLRLPGSTREITVRSNELEDGQRVATVRVSTSNAHADTLAGYLHRGDLYSASSMAGWAEKAEDLLEQKMADPFAAVVGAYLLLRTRNIDLLHDWTRNLMESFPRIPDAVVIRAWHLIYRRGAETEIRALFERALDGSLPIFTEGLRLLSDGVRLLGDDSEKAVAKLNHHVRRSLSHSPFTATLDRSETESNWDVDIGYASRA
jgi:hypothetical protein